MGLDEQAVATGGDAGAGHGRNHVGTAAGYACGLVGLLQGVSDVEYHRAVVALHLGDAAVVDDKILVAERGAALGYGHAVVAGLTLDPEQRLLKRVTITDAAEADRIFSMLMGEDVGPRRDFIETNANYANIDA